MVQLSERAQKLDAWCKEVGEKRRKNNVHYLDVTFEDSSGNLRDLLRKGLLKMTDLRDDPSYFFEAHRVIAKHSEDLGGGFWTRFTVQFNLFAGTVIAVGNQSQIKQLEEMQAKGHLGCFGLTEKFAGVSSGMVVETIAEYDAGTQEFVLRSPNEGSYKNWISQGFCADKSVVIADLHINGKSHGAHAFLIDFRVNGEVVPNIRLADMGRKTVANDLDNAWIAFDGARVPASALLDRYAGINDKGVYSQQKKGMHTMEQVGQRLFTGRVAVAEAALEFGRDLFAKTREYTDSKTCWAPKGMRPPLSMLPQLSTLYDEAEEAFDYVEKYLTTCEQQLVQCLRQDRIPAPPLIEAIGIAKVRSVETVIQLCFRLKQTVGSRALMVGSGFEALDGMQVAKFAEGESFVLMQKLARDNVKNTNAPGMTEEEKAICEDLRGKGPQEWVAKFDKVYQLAELVMDRTMKRVTGSDLPQGIARPFAKL
eukprot:gnl/MRDRNA2_/MRDRNA2_97596_c0_seq1.p1 gnl/MRDRNA2_/MRDRNA2_97596_c0~~gnl/MRDRNA2_/MRDRNA2_97596_c0_seq1.p1  ORF type:complete len:480 (-),score=107.86 gnl/MRDRNA2_/MRDRNA2_97596_c0_seq1:287-1726(-)